MIAEKDRIISTARTSETESAEEESRSQLVLLVAFAIVSFREGSFLRQEGGGLGGKEGRCGYWGNVDREVCRGGDLM